MLVSAEVRWFWKDDLPPTFEAGFRAGRPPPGGGKPRLDEYVIDRQQRELGVKRRARNPGIEIKGLVETRGPLPPWPARHVQIWTKWTSHAVSIDSLPRIPVEKTRWIRKYDTSGAQVRELELDADERLRAPGAKLPSEGCNVELVALRVGRERTPWWTFAFEAFGSLATVERSLQRGAAYLTPFGGDAFARAHELSYPEWLVDLKA